MKELADRINQFIDKYAAISPDYDEASDEGKYTSPDAYQMLDCAKLLSNEIKPQQCHSDWGSGGYRPYASKEGRKEHDYLVKEVYKIINS